VSDAARASAIRHGDLAFHNPLAPDRVDEALRQLDLGPGDRAFDVGCGPGELLIRLAELCGCGGVGVDSAEGQIEEARRRAAARVPSAALEFVAGDAAAVEPGDIAAAACVGSTHALGGLAPALERLASVGTVLIGEGFWARRPSSEYLEALGGATEDELTDLPGLLRAGEPFGLEPVWVATTTPREWERYEWTLVANGDRFVRAHGDDPLAVAVAEANVRTRERLLLPGGTDTLGFALVVFRSAAFSPR
jgi:SAM-dependent methyltransferase